MNNELETKEYLKTLELIKLSDSSRERIKGGLVSYARFHSATEVEVSTTARRGPFMKFAFSPVPAAFALVLLVGATSLLAKEAAPGDFLYAVKTGVSENFRGAFALVTKDTKNPDEASQVQLANETTVENEVSTSSDTLAKNDKANKKEKNKGTLALNTRTTAMLESGSAQEDDILASDASLDLSTMLSKGTISIEDYTSDVKLRDKTLRDLIKKYDIEIQSNIKTDFKNKLDTVVILLVETEGATETEAWAHLDKATGLIGEIEAKLSTLGEVTVKDGLIVDIDFSVDMTAPKAKDEDDSKSDVDAVLDTTSSVEL